MFAQTCHTDFSSIKRFTCSVVSVNISLISCSNFKSVSLVCVFFIYFRCILIFLFIFPPFIIIQSDSMFHVFSWVDVGDQQPNCVPRLLHLFT